MIRVLINPRSGDGIQGKGEAHVLDQIRRTLAEPLEVFRTESPEHLTQLAKDSSRPNCSRLLLIGGDGTLNLALQGLMGIPEELRPLVSVARAGTGGDFARGLGLTEKNWIQALSHFQETRVDVGVVDVEGGHSHYFLNMFSCGVTATIATRRGEAARRLPRSLRYLVPTLLELPRLQSLPLRILWKGGEFRGDLLTLMACKGAYAGGGMRLGGGVSLDDGLLDIKVIRPLSFARALTQFPRIYRGDFSGIPEVVQMRLSDFELISDREILVETDGEVFGLKRARVSVHPRALQLTKPRAD